MTPCEALQLVRRSFPFPDSMKERDAEYLSVANSIMRHLQPPAKVLDFGSGACEKAAILQALGYCCYACDDLQDNWHLQDNNRERIVSFAQKMGIEFRLAGTDGIPFTNESFDVVMLNAVLEHLHDSPRVLLTTLLHLLRENGLLLVTVPNAVNIRKRIAVLLGRTNLPPFESYFWYLGPWRGHVREYVKGDLVLLAEYLGLSIVELRSCHHMLYKVPPMARPLYKAVTQAFRGWRDSWLLVARKPPSWAPRERPCEKGMDVVACM